MTRALRSFLYTILSLPLIAFVVALGLLAMLVHTLQVGEC